MGHFCLLVLIRFIWLHKFIVNAEQNSYKLLHSDLSQESRKNSKYVGHIPPNTAKNTAQFESIAFRRRIFDELFLSSEFILRINKND